MPAELGAMTAAVVEVGGVRCVGAEVSKTALMVSEREREREEVKLPGGDAARPRIMSDAVMSSPRRRAYR